MLKLNTIAMNNMKRKTGAHSILMPSATTTNERTKKIILPSHAYNFLMKKYNKINLMLRLLQLIFFSHIKRALLYVRFLFLYKTFNYFNTNMCSYICKAKCCCSVFFTLNGFDDFFPFAFYC